MELEDRASIRTPEGIDLELTLAGLGSRFGAALIDSLVVLVLLVLAAFGSVAVGSAVRDDLGLLLTGVVSLTLLSVLIGYFVAFEVGNGGRTPGKAAFGIRVVGTSGEPVGLWPSLVRNLVRIVDFLPAFYAVGAASILASGRNQRIGDLAGATMVIRDRVPARAEAGLPELPAGAAAARWDVSGVGQDEVALIRRFLERRASLTPARRAELAGRIALGLRGKVSGVERAYPDEELLARILAEKLDRER